MTNILDNLIYEWLTEVVECSGVPYSETFRIRPDGLFDDLRMDGTPALLPNYFDFDTPEELYHLAAEIQKRHPNYQFGFTRDNEGSWMKYTVVRLYIAL